MTRHDEQLQNDAVDQLDEIINSAYAAKESILANKFEDALGDLEDIPGSCKQAVAFVEELCSVLP